MTDQLKSAFFEFFVCYLELEQFLEDYYYDPDEGLELRPEVAERLERSVAVSCQRGRGSRTEVVMYVCKSGRSNATEHEDKEYAKIAIHIATRLSEAHIEVSSVYALLVLIENF